MIPEGKTRPSLTAVEAEAILILAHALSRATAAYTMSPFEDEWAAVKKAEKNLREFVYKLAGGL